MPMAEHLFFNLEGELEEVANKLFTGLDINYGIMEGDSSNVLYGVYFYYSVFGVGLKLEYNSYEFDEKYRYMLSIQKNVLSTIDADNKVINSFKDIILLILPNVLHTEIAYEKPEGGLEIYLPQNIL